MIIISMIMIIIDCDSDDDNFHDFVENDEQDGDDDCDGGGPM